MFGLNSKKWLKGAQKTEKVAKKYNKSLYNTWNRMVQYFGLDFNEFLVADANKLSEYENSLVYLEMLAFTKRVGLVQNLTTWGYYHSALLELRFILETTTLAYYLDNQLPNTDRAEKIKLMQKHKGELWGNRLRRRAYMYEKPLGLEIEKVITEINNSIDEYMADRSAEDWKNPSIPFAEKDFNECVHHSKNATALILKHFIKSFENFKYNGELIITHKDEQQTETLHLDEIETTPSVVKTEPVVEVEKPIETAVEEPVVEPIEEPVEEIAEEIIEEESTIEAEEPVVVEKTIEETTPSEEEAIVSEPIETEETPIAEEISEAEIDETED